MGYKRKKITKKEELEVLRLSPSSINTFYQCPKKFYKIYIEALEQVDSLVLTRGTAVHAVLEDIMKQRWVPAGEKFRTSMEKKSMDLFEMHWKKSCEPFSDDDNYDVSKAECKFIVERFIKRFCDNIQNGINIGKFQNETQGYYFTRPSFKELWLDDQYKIKMNEKFKKVEQKDKIPIENSLNVGGFIDAVQKNFDNELMLIDYKTSNKYKNALSEDYVRQLSIYAYLWRKQTGKMPNYVAINYLKFDESFYILVTSDLINKATADIKTMRSRLVEWGMDESQYYKKEGKLCEYCVNYEKCMENGQD